MAVVDASVWVSICHAGDRFHGRCRDWLSSRLANGEVLIAPSLLAVEVAAAIRRLTGDASLAAEASKGLLEAGPVRLLPLTHSRSRASAELAARLGLRGADAVYLALAMEKEKDLVTLDRQQLERGRGVVKVSRP